MPKSARSRLLNALSSWKVVLYSLRRAYAAERFAANAAKRSASETVAVRFSVINAIFVVFRLRLCGGRCRVLLCSTFMFLLRLHNR